jgi:class 3 adenylate cyclase
MSPEMRLSLGLRAKVIIAFCVLSSLVSLALGASTYAILNRNLLRELQNRVRNLAEAGSLFVDREALRRLTAAARPGLDAGRVGAIERSADYARISAQLNRLRDTERALIRFVYTFVPTADENRALYLVDADLLEDAAAGGTEVSHFASPFDVSDFPVARRALREKAVLVEPQYTRDEEFGVSSITGYAPVFDTDGTTLLAVLGMDMVDSDARRVLGEVTLVSLVVAAAALAVSIATSVIVGTLFTRGIVQLDEVVRAFDERNLGVRADIRSRDEVGRLGLSFNQMADLIQRYAADQKALLDAYGRFVPHDFLRFLGKQRITDVALGDQVARDMTVLFSDIRSFTELSESMSPEENFNFLNSYLSRVGPEIRANRGFIDKYIGDAVMALFPESADDAVRAAIAMKVRLREYNGHRASSGYQALRVGIGIHTGRLMLGTLGEKERMDGSVISDAVNLCSRVESLTRYYGDTILMTNVTLSRLENARAFRTRLVARVRVKGRRESVPIYEVFDGDSPDVLEQKLASLPEWKDALSLYYNQQFAQAFKVLARLHTRFPKDAVYERVARLCAAVIRHGAPAGWDGVETIAEK